MFYEIEERPPTAAGEIACREQLLTLTTPIAKEYGLDLEPFTAWQDDLPVERVQGVFLHTKIASGQWCIGAIVRRNSGELRMWPRDESAGPIQGSTAIAPAQLDTSILEMVEQFTAA